MNDTLRLAGLQPVFPMSERVAVGDRERVTVVSTGLTLRDLFALEAMKVYITEAKDRIFVRPEEDLSGFIADQAYGMAEAMLQRSQEES